MADIAGGGCQVSLMGPRAIGQFLLK